MKFRKLLAMVLAVAMIASLAPVLRTTAKAAGGTGVGADGIYLAKGTTENPGIQFSEEEITSAPYYPGSVIRYKIIVTFSQEIALKNGTDAFKIHNYNTSHGPNEKYPDGSTLYKDYNGQIQLENHNNGNADNEQFKIYAYETSNPNITMSSESEREIKFNVAATDGSYKVNANDTITLWVQFPVTEHSNAKKTLDNFLDITVKANKDVRLGKEYGKGITFGGSTDETPSGTFPLEIINNIEDETSSKTEFTYTITSNNSFTQEISGVQFTNGKSAEIKLGDGDSKILYLPTANNYVVTQEKKTNYTTTSTHYSVEIKDIGTASKETTYNANDANNGNGTEKEYTWKVQENNANKYLHNVTFTNKFIGSAPLPPSPTGATYHLNLPNDSEFSGLYDKDFAYTDTDSEKNGVLEIGGIPQWAFEGDTITTSSDKFAGYQKGVIGTSSTYYFVGWSNDGTNLSYNESGEYNYKDIKYPVVNIGGDDNGTRNIYAYPTGSEGNSAQKQNEPFECEDSDLYAIWVKADNSTGNRGLYGYTMQLAGAKFPGAEGDDPLQWFTQSGGAGAKLGLNGYNSNETWLKYAVLDGGHYKGDNKPLTVEAPNTPVDGWDFIGWFNKNANKGDDPNKDYFVAPAGGRVTGANNQVEYGDSHGVYSVDAIWSKITGATDQVVLYKAGGSSPDFSNIAVNLTDGGYTNGSGRSDQTGWESIFGAKGTSVTAARDKLSYYVEVSGPENIGRTKYTQSELSDIKLTKPGKYTITVNPKLEDVDTSGGKGGKTGVTIDFGTITFNYTIIPQLTVEVTKTIKGDDAWNLDHGDFKFTVTSTGDTTVAPGTITINKSTPDHKDTALITFGKGDTIASPGTYTITITETGGSAAGMTYNTTAKTITVTLGADGTLSGAGIDADPTSEGNYKTAVTIENTYNTGSLTVTKEVAPSNTSKGDGKDFTITVTLTKGEFPETLSTDIVGTATATRTSATVVTLSLQKGASVTIKDLPVGAEYTVEETDPGDGSTSSITSGGSGTIKAGSNEVTVTNTYPAPTGKLTITKTVTGTNAPSEWSFEFTVKAPTGVTFTSTSYGSGVTRTDDTTLTVTVKNDAASVTIENLPIGTYTVTEDVPAGYEFNVTGDNVTRTSGENAFTAAITEDGTTTAAVTNTFLTGNLKITKKVTGTNAPASDTFTFTIKAAGDTVAKVANKTFDSVHFDANGVSATVTITTASKEGSVTIENLPIGNYTVEETAKTHYTPDPASHNVTLDQDGEEITFTNTYNQPTGSLTITKTVAGVASASGQVFTFTVTAPAGKIADDTTFGSATFKNNQATVTIEMDTSLTKSVTIAGLPTGYYKVEENTADLSDYNTTYAPDDAPSTGVNVTEGGTAIATVTNTHKTGNLTIRKTVTGSGPAVPTNGTFTFTVRATGDTVAKVAGETYGDVTFDKDGKSGNVTFTVTGTSGTKTITGLPIGTYTVTEAKVDGYKADAETKSVTLDQDGEEITFTNTYQTGTLKITKTVDGIASASGKEFTFTITAPADKIADGTKFTVTGASDITFNGDKATVTIVMGTDLSKTVTIANLPAGTYTVEETEMAANYTVDGAASKTVSITGGSTEIVAITNKYDTGDLTITKNVTGGTNVKVSQTFTFTVKAPENLIKGGTSFTVIGGGSAVFNEHGEADVTVTLSNSDTGSVTIKGLPVGQYTITEKEAQGYTIPGSVTVTVAKGTTPATATITNELQTAELKITKAELKHDPNVDLPTNPTFEFTVAFKDFPAGVTSFDLNVGGTSKTVTTADNTVIFTLEEKGSQTLAGVPGGIGFEVTEAFQSDEQGRHFTTEWFNRTGVVESDTEVNCTNTYHMLEKGNGALVIRKEAVGGQAGTVYQFKVTFTQGGNPYTGQIGGKTLGSDGSATFEMDDTANHSLVIQVPVGVTYKVEEVFASGERPKAISVGLEQNEAGDSTSGETASGTISQEFNYDSVIFTNRYLGDLKISKTVPQFDGGEVFTFTVTLPTGTYTYTGDKSGTISSGGTVTLKAGESITIQNLPAGSSYAVTEAGTANYTAEASVITGTIANNTTAAAAFTNNRNTGRLTVTKTLTGKLATSSDTFTFTVTLTGVGTGFTDTLDGVEFKDGVGTFTMGEGSRTITGLPVGAGFTVKEQDASGYVTTYNNDPANHDKAEGTISANPTTVTVNNDKPDTGTITIKKVVKNAPAADANKIFNFTITLYLDEDLTNVATDINGEHSGFNFTNGVAPFKLKNGDSVIGEGEVTVSEGRLFYKIEETADPNYTTTSTTSDANGNSGGSVVTGEFTQDSQNTIVTFTNTYNYGDLTITKKVTDDSGASHASDKFTFTITKVGDSTFNQTVEITGANSDTVSLPAGDYVVTETAGMGDSVAYQVGTSGSSAANAEVTITAGGTVTVTVTNTYYSGGGTGGTGGGTPSPDIDTSEHYGYIIGVTHTEVAPEQNITRAEIATILFRLLTDEARAANWSENSGFPDVKSGVWYNHAVAVLHKMGIILGDDNGNFNPDQNITRAEVAAMVVRFYEVAEGTVLNNRFTDVETTKWYAEAVLLADYYGLMQGDGDAFKPEDLLTRAEAMTVFNRLLGRKPHKDHLHKDMITWTDNTDKNKWYYAEVQEATNSHTCGNNVVIDGKIYETWSAITKMRDWAALEY